MSVSEKTRESTTIVTRTKSSSVDTEGPESQTNFDEPVRFQSQTRKKWVRELGDYMGLLMAEAAHFVWPAHHPCHYLEEISDQGSSVAGQKGGETG